MLDMGFAPDVNRILEEIPTLKQRAQKSLGVTKEESDTNVQVLLFSATLPSWVQDVAKKYMSKPVTVDLVGNSDMQASTDVEHLILQCPWHARAKAIADLIQVYAKGTGSVIVFTDTKKEANELAVDENMKMECGVSGQACSSCILRLSLFSHLQILHGDIVQSQRETTLKAFRDGRLRVLIATDVAARGLDIKGVELVINSQPPSKNFTDRADVETYVHRSGRTGRAGSKGVCITLFKHNQKGILDEIAQATNNTFKRIGAPQVRVSSFLRSFPRIHSFQLQPADIVRATAFGAVEQARTVHEEALDLFRDAAEQAVDEFGEFLHCCCC